MGLRRTLVTGQLVREFQSIPRKASVNAEFSDVGNAWAAAGMMRVWSIINRSSFSSQMQSQKNNLTQWVDEILTGVWRYQVRCRVPWDLLGSSVARAPAAKKRDALELRRPARFVRGLGVNSSARGDDVPVQPTDVRREARCGRNAGLEPRVAKHRPERVASQRRRPVNVYPATSRWCA